MRYLKISVVKFLLLGISMLMLGTSLFAQATVTLPNATGQSGTEQVLPLAVDFTGKNVTSFQFRLYFDPSKIEVYDAVAAGLTAGQAPTVNYVVTPNGELRVAWASATGLNTAGTLLNLKVKLKAPTTGAGTTMSFVDPSTSTNTLFVFDNNGSIPVTVTPNSGVITIPSKQITVVNSADKNVGDEFLIPLKTSALTAGDNIFTYNFTGTFNKSILNILGVETAGTVSAGGSIVPNVNNTNGTISVAFASATKITANENDVLVYLKVKAVGKGQGTLALTTFKFNDGEVIPSTFNGTYNVINRAPVVTPIPEQKGKEKVSLSLDLKSYFSDADGDALTYSVVATTLPAGYTLTNGVLAWTPDYNHKGSYTATFKATDGTLDVTSELVTITIADSNRVPSVALNPVGPFSGNQGVAINFAVVGTDADVAIDDKLTYTMTPIAGATLDANTGAFSWTPAFNQSGKFDVTFTATDKSGAYATVSTSITVSVVNTAPSFSLAGAAKLPNTTIREGQAFTFTYKAIDPQGDVVKYYIVNNKPAGAQLDELTGVFSWTPAVGQNGSYLLSVVATDGTNNSEQVTSLITVVANHKPTIALTPAGTDKMVAEQSPISFSVATADEDAGDVVTLTNTTLPNGATFVNGVFAWTPALGQKGSYAVTFTAKDKSNETASVTVNITVTKNNLAPVFVNTLKDTTIPTGTTLKFTYTTTDGNNDVVTYSLATPVPAGATIDAATGAMTFAANETATKTYTLVVVASDGALTTSTSAKVTVFVPTFAISGIVTYDNDAATPVKGVTVTVKGASQASVVTGDDGKYSFSGLIAGTYTVEAAKSTPFEGVNAADALVAARYFNNMITLDPVQMLAGDVNNNNNVNNADALAIVQRYVGLITKFDRADWTFVADKASVTVTDQSVVDNFKALVTGDLNKSYVPTNLAKASVALNSSAQMDVAPKASFEMPVVLTDNMEVAAVSMKFAYPANIVRFDGISTMDSRILASAKDGIISLAFADLTGGKEPINVKANQILAKIRFTLLDAAKEGEQVSLELVNGEVVNSRGEVLKSSLNAPMVNVALPTEFTVSQNYPNPFNPTTTIAYTLPASGNITVKVYNVNGQEIANLVNGMQEAGAYKVVWNAANMASGIYYYRIHFEGVNNTFTQTKSMVLLK